MADKLKKGKINKQP